MRVISAEDAARHIAADLRTRTTTRDLLPPDVIVAEYIRRSLCDLAARESGAFAYVTAITNNVRRQLGAVWPSLELRRNKRPSQREQQAEGDIQPDTVRRVFESLIDLREVEHLGNGYYTPTPTRCVRLDDEFALVLGGSPTDDIRNQIGDAVISAWIARTIRLSELSDCLRHDASLWQSKEAWLGTPPLDLERWTAEYLERAQRELESSGAGITDFEVYHPLSTRGPLQAFRWTSVKTLRPSLDSLLLCRAFEGRFGIRRYWLGTLVRSHVERRAGREYRVEPADVRRLQYGIDALQHLPTEVRIHRRAPMPRLTLTNLLPPEERRALIALGRDCSVRPGKFPLRYELAESHLPVIVQLLKSLGVTVTTE